MHDAQTLDAEITRMYTTGESTTAISRNLGLRASEVISRIRALNLVPPGMGFRRPTNPEAVAPVKETAPACSISPAPAQPSREPAPERAARKSPAAAEKPRSRRATAAADAALVGYDEDEDGDDLATLPGRPKGWLVTESEMNAIFTRGRGRFEDVRLRQVRR
ncbi:hypothetical protein [Arenibaculum pallidiluteum]|uniref:hypothetical protein n=1 Tax=Arenibaculum pallidiluteum TaxID=2812559 RepID=UPI001A97037D|nr:hypothetical protein [Arenibaculum pallidiluteum]